MIEYTPVTRTPVHTPPAGPRLGEHTVQVLREAGYTPEEVDARRRERVVVQHDEPSSELDQRPTR